MVSYHDPKVKAILGQMHANEKRTGSKLLNSTSVIKARHNGDHCNWRWSRLFKWP